MRHTSWIKLPKLPLTALEGRVVRWTKRHALTLLRLAMGIIFVWFGALKMCDLSPATDLVNKTTQWIPIADFCTVLGIWEVLIGLCFFYKPWLRYALVFLVIHMPGTMLPLVLLPQVVYVQFPFALTLEGQYIIKNLIIIAGALVLTSHLQRSDGRGRSPLTAQDPQPEDFEEFLPATGLAARTSLS